MTAKERPRPAETPGNDRYDALDAEANRYLTVTGRLVFRQSQEFQPLIGKRHDLVVVEDGQPQDVNAYLEGLVRTATLTREERAAVHAEMVGHYSISNHVRVTWYREGEETVAMLLTGQHLGTIGEAMGDYVTGDAFPLFPTVFSTEKTLVLDAGFVQRHHLHLGTQYELAGFKTAFRPLQ